MHIDVCGLALYLVLFTRCTSAWRQYSTLSLYDGKTCGGNDALFTTNTPLQMLCVTLCSITDTCVAAFHKEDGTCVGCLKYATSLVATLQNDPGTTYLYGRVDCKPGWYDFEGSCYYMDNSVIRTWSAAKTFCEEEGAMLAEVTQSSTQNFLVEKLRTINTASLNVWIGGQLISGTWKWSSSQQSIDQVYWMPGEPNDSPDFEECLGMYRDSDHEWNDSICSFSFMFVCEIKEI